MKFCTLDEALGQSESYNNLRSRVEELEQYIRQKGLRMNEVSTVTETPVVHPDLAIPAEFKREDGDKANGKKKEVVQVAEDLGTPEVLH